MSYDPNDPFYMPYHDLEVAKLVVSGQHEVQIEYKKLKRRGTPDNQADIYKLRMTARFMGYPTMLDHFNPF